MFGVEEDTKPLLDRIEEVEKEKHGLANKVAGLEKQLGDQGITPDQQKMLIEIQELKRRLEANNLEIERLKKQQIPTARAILPTKPVTIRSPQQPGAPAHTTPAYPHSSNSEISGWGYRGAGGSQSINPTLQPGNGSTNNSLGYEPDGISPISVGLQYSGANTPHNNPEYVESVTSPEALDQNMKSKLCPVHKAQGRDIFMTPAKLYGTRVDINENGIWFDKGELLEIVSKLQGETWRDLAGVITQWSQDKSQISIQRNKLVEIRTQYDDQYRKFLHLNAIVQAGGPEKYTSISEYRALAGELRQKEEQIKRGVDITPGKVVTFGKTASPAPGHTDLKFCPVEMAGGRKIIMARVEIFGEKIDASKNGLWFDKGELLEILKKVQAKNRGILDKMKQWLNSGGILEDLEKQVAARIAKVRERDEAHVKLQDKKKNQQFGQEYEELQERYTRLSRELDSSVDITPRWLNL